MNRRIITSALVLALPLCIAGASSTASMAASPATPTATATAPTKAKMVSFHLRNDAATPLTVQVGDQQVTIEPGKAAEVKAREGAQIVAISATAHLNAGDVVSTVSKLMQGNTLAVS